MKKTNRTMGFMMGMPTAAPARPSRAKPSYAADPTGMDPVKRVYISTRGFTPAVKRATDEQVTREAFEARLKSTSENDFVSLSGPMTPDEVHNALNMMMAAARKR